MERLPSDKNDNRDLFTSKDNGYSMETNRYNYYDEDEDDYDEDFYNLSHRKTDSQTKTDISSNTEPNNFIANYETTDLFSKKDHRISEPVNVSYTLDKKSEKNDSIPMINDINPIIKDNQVPNIIDKESNDNMIDFNNFDIDKYLKELYQIQESTQNKATENVQESTVPVNIENHETINSRQNVIPSKKAPPPFINFVTFNRLGLTIKNLGRLLESKEDFELHIIDCNSKDNSWDYVQSLTDPRIKSKTRFEQNLGPIYALNYALSRRKPDQYFITVDSDTYIKTENWIARYMEIFDAFPDVGVLGIMRDDPYPRFMPPVIPRMNGNISYLELKNAKVDEIMDFIPGHLQMLRPELIREIGYWSEENGYGDAELSPRVVHYTNFKVGFVPNVEINMAQTINCDVCLARDFCKLSRSVNSCYSLSKRSNKNESFVKKYKWKYMETFKELEEGKRTAYCASIHDPSSMIGHVYHKDWAEENFNHYRINSN